MTVEEFDRWEQLIRRASSFVVHDFPGVERDDISQSLWEHVLRSPELDPDNPGCSSILVRVGKKLAWLQRKEHLQLSVQYQYRTSDLKEILETSFEYEDWGSGYCPADARSVDGMGPVDIRSDVLWGLKKLPSNYRASIYRRFKDKIDDPSDSAERRQSNRAVKKLADVLNSYYRANSLGNRNVMTNAQANYIIEGLT